MRALRALVAWVALCSTVAGGCAAAPPASGAVPPAETRAGTRWVPPPGATWQWQLTGPIDTGVDADVFDIDGVESSAETVAALHRAGRKVVCYVDVGAAEEFRPDHAAFPDAVQGNSGGFAGERLLDIRRIDVLRPIMAARFDMCRGKGFDAVEADLVDGYTRDSGFPLTPADQLTYNRMLADLAHERGLSIGLKNDLDQVADLVDHFDFAINEECFQYEECASAGTVRRRRQGRVHRGVRARPGRLLPRRPQRGLQLDPQAPDPRRLARAVLSARRAGLRTRSRV